MPPVVFQISCLAGSIAEHTVARGGKGRNEIGMKAQLVQDQLFTSPPLPPLDRPRASWLETHPERTGQFS